MNYDETKIAEHYNRGRRISPDTMQVWMDAIARRVNVDEVTVIADVGCGTGRFSVALADAFGAEVIGIDPATTMLAKAREGQPDSRITFKRGHAEELPLPDQSVDMVFMSMAYHHLDDPFRAARELARVLRHSGRVVIRNSTVEVANRIPYVEYFPTALEINRRKLPAVDAVTRAMQSAGLFPVSHEVITQRFADSFEEYYEKIRLRALSDLTMVSDEEFEAGLGRMKDDLRSGRRTGPVIEPIDLFVFVRPRKALAL